MPARAATIAYAFKNAAWADGYLQGTLAAQTTGGSEIGETFAAAAQVRVGDCASWQAAFREMAERVEELAVESDRAGHAVSARDCYLRASNYYRAMLVQMGPRIDPGYHEVARRIRARFARAAALSEGAIEPFEMPFEHGRLPGYVLHGDDGEGPAKTVIVVGGADSFAEDLYHWYGAQGARRGYKVVLVDLPGQGLTASDGFRFRPDSETALGALVAHIGARPDVDASRIAAIGFSLGGYLVPRAASAGVPLRAIVAASIFPDFEDHWRTIPLVSTMAEWEGTWKMALLARLFGRRMRVVERSFDTYKERWGARSIAELVEKAAGWRFDPGAIPCPTLILAPQSDYDGYGLVRARVHDALDRIPHPRKRLTVLPSALGAGRSIGGPNLSVCARMAFDWLDEAIDAQTQRTTHRPTIAPLRVA